MIKTLMAVSYVVGFAGGVAMALTMGWMGL